MPPAPLLVWSWRSLPGPSAWPTGLRVRALAIGHALATRAGYGSVFYGDDAARHELDGLPWPWEVRRLPQTGADRVPDAFWSGSKLVALRDARETTPDGTPVVHIDHDGWLTGWLPDLDAPLYAQNHQPRAPSDRWYPDMREAFGDDLPPWWEAWRKADRVHECGLVGGSSRYAVGAYVDEALRCAALLEQRGTLARAHTWTLEQGVHAAMADELGVRVGFALDEKHRGANYATWPGDSHGTMPLERFERALPAGLAAALDARFERPAVHRPPVHPLGA